MQEVWRPVVGWEGLYSVSDWGSVRGEARTVIFRDGRVRKFPEKVLKLIRGSNGYLVVSLKRNSVCTVRLVHSLVAEAFIGPRPEGLIVLHGSDGKQDNRLKNLSYGTYGKNNGEDKERDGTTLIGERNPYAKATLAQVLYIRQQLESGPYGTAARLAKELGLSQDLIGCIKRGKSWAWVKD
jgi:hypothetical protein